MTKCDFCRYYHPSGRDRSVMTCNASDYELKYDNACEKALERFTAVSMTPIPGPAPEVPKPVEGDFLDRLFGGIR